MASKENYWPTEKQQLLLKAALLPEKEAIPAWEAHCQTVDLQTTDFASLALLPLVYRNLKQHDDPAFMLCKGKYRYVWCANNVLWKTVSALFTKWASQGVDKIIVLKGMAMILQWYRDFGVRVLGDVDILVDKKHLPLIVSSLLDSGWTSHVARFDPENPDHLQRWHALNFTHPSGTCLDVHWSLLAENAQILDPLIFEHAIPISSQEPWLYVPSPTDLLFQTCIHGMKQSPEPLIRWIADASTLLFRAENVIEWDRMIDFAQKAHVSLPLSQALQFLSQNFAKKIPLNVLKTLQQSPVLSLERKVQWFYARGYRELGAWYRFCLNQGHHTWISRWLHMPKYLQHTARLRSLWTLPFFLIYWISKRALRKGILMTNAKRFLKQTF